MHIIFGFSCFIGLLLATASHASLRVRDSSNTYPDPSEDPFYQPPSNVGSLRPGDVIRSRAVTTRISASKVKASYQVLYRTTDTQGNPEVTVTTVWEPITPRSPPQILSYHSYMDSDSFDCSPSYGWLKHSKSEGWAPLITDAPVFIDWALGHGIYVEDPDDEGPKAAFIAGFQQGQAALDGMRATRNFFELPRSTEIAMTGYSGGGSVTVWAGNLASRYAPDLNIIGAAYGGTPIDPRNIFNHLNGGPFAALAGAGLIGLMSAYPAMNKYIFDHIGDKAVKLIAKFRGRNKCVQDVITSDLFTNFFKLINVTDPLNTPIISSVLARESLLMNVSSVGVSVPRFPRLIFHAKRDEIIPFADEQLYVTQQCQHGANIQFQVLEVAEHTTGEFEGIPGAIKFLGQVFNKTTPEVKCGTGPSIVTNLARSAASSSSMGSGGKSESSMLGDITKKMKRRHRSSRRSNRLVVDAGHRSAV